MTMTWYQRGGAVLAAAATLSVVTVAPLAAAPVAVDSPVEASGLQTAVRLERYFTYCGQRDPYLLGYDRFYSQHCEAQGLDVIASASVDPAALENVAEVIIDMIGHRQDLIDAMVAGGVRFGVIGATELTTDMPEYKDIGVLFPGIDVNERARALGATSTQPLVSAAEENILCDPSDRWFGLSNTVHEFAHTILSMGLRRIDPSYTDTITTDPVVGAWLAAIEAGLWPNTYAITLPDEYWAQTVGAYFDANLEGPVGGDGTNNEVNTRAELAEYDPRIYAIIDDLFAEAPPLNLCLG